MACLLSYDIKLNGFKFILKFLINLNVRKIWEYGSSNPKVNIQQVIVLYLLTTMQQEPPSAVFPTLFTLH